MKELSELQCPHCDGTVKIPFQCSTVVCSYCNTTIQTKTGLMFKEHYMMRLQFGVQESKEKLFSWAMKQRGAPDDFDRAEVKKSELIFWPFWVVEVEANATYAGHQKKPKFPSKEVFPRGKISWEFEYEEGTIDLENDFFVPANPKMPKSLMEYSIPIRRKDYFDQAKIMELRGIVKEVYLNQDDAIAIARSSMLDVVHQEALNEIEIITKSDNNLKITAIFLIEIPIWHIEYSYNNTQYCALVDGASGRVISINFPRKESFRNLTRSIGYMHLGVGGGISFLLIYLGLTLFDGLFPTFFGIVLGFEMMVFSMLFFREARLLGTVKEGEQ